MSGKPQEGIRAATRPAPSGLDPPLQAGRGAQGCAVSPRLCCWDLLQPLLLPSSLSAFFSLIWYFLSISNSFFLLFSDAHQAFKIIIYLIDAHLCLSALCHSVSQSLPFILTFETKDGHLCLYVVSVRTHAEQSHRRAHSNRCAFCQVVRA